ncbi:MULTISPECIES: hypothetical protein [Ralstonia]|uniref:hypothetical protein n=1 Tax=Ralstonia TaxID=48736 RepID=UPI00056A1EC2|nr:MULTISPECIES: hypothetical protein [Ralstonia]MCM3580821.1 hypothetical protein [Ralstonia pickettii]MEA3269603.1 hypothetical protein [Pseudomonadota bacterium]PCI27661.1 MAG: hypothetical protein COB55_05340 [Candidatus Wolfebacteria bacterium]MDR9383577.1 hypothetical protein [Ralstonia sp. 11b]OYU22744.1 MAG: hypothetical protein CFE42_12665 [Ralstonia sp. PBBBR1]
MPAVLNEVTLVAALPAPTASVAVGPPLVDLLFDQPVATDANLVFGANYIAPRDDVTVRATLPLPVIAIKFIPPARAELLAELPGLTVRSLVLRPSVPLNVGAGSGASLPGVVFSGDVRYYSRTQRPTVGQTAHSWQVAAQTEGGSTQGQQDAAATPAGWNSFWRRTLAQPQGILHRLPPVLSTAPEQRRTGQQQATRLHDVTWLAHQDGTHLELARQGLFQNAGPIRDATRFRHQDGDRTKRAGRVSFWQIARLLTQLQGSDFQSASPSLKGWRGRYQDAVPPPPGISVWVVPQPPAPTPCYTPSAHLLFAALAPADSHLLFVCENHINPPPPDGEPVVVPVRRVYFVINNVTLYRVSDGAPVPVFNLSLSLDAASWAWGFDAVLPAKAEALVAPGNASGPVELLASVNGTTFRVLAESISRERIFGNASIRISGRGHNAVLAAPYAPVMTFSNTEGRTARQLMDDVLTVNGIPLGWTVDWGLTDWNVPAGAFAQQGTWIEALTAIAGAAGGYLIPHPSAQAIRVRHRYPAAPWDWATVTPDFVLPVDAVARESLRWLEKPAYNRVFVSGQDVGVLGQVTRAGTAGEVLAPMVVDPLITEAAAARQRGIAVLADTAQQIEVSLRLPVLAETGIIEPGAFVEYQDGSVTRLGIVRATQVEAGMPEVWQTLGVQAYA